MRKVQFTETVLRDANQSLIATRLPYDKFEPILETMDQAGFYSAEVWGGATFDVCLRYLREDPWDRLRKIRAKMPNTKLQMLLRGQNILGYKHYPDDVVRKFVEYSVKNGIDIIRIFDALNDVRNLEVAIDETVKQGAHASGTICFTTSPVHTLEKNVQMVKDLKKMGVSSICIKDMAGMLTPYRAERMVKAFNAEIGLPLHIHCHYVGGMAPANILKAAEAGAAIADTAHAPLAFGNSHPAVEMIVAALQESRYDTGLDLDLLFEIAEYWEEVRKRGHYKRGVSSLTHMKVYSHQVPGGMMSNLLSQLEVQNASDRLPEVMREIPKVRAEVGYPPLVTPMSQIVGTQAVFNVILGERYKMVTKEFKGLVHGDYGKTPAPIKPEFTKKILGDEQPITCRFADTLAPEMDKLKAEAAKWATQEEDVLTYAMFPQVAPKFFEKRNAKKQGVDGDHVDYTNQSHPV